MARVKNKNTKLVVLVRTFLFSKGLRFRKNDKRYLGWIKTQFRVL